MSKDKLQEYPLYELALEIQRRQIEGKQDDSLVVGSIVLDAGKPYVEIFKKIESVEDLDFLSPYSLRMRFNGHRKYKLFYFKTDQYDLLNKNLNQDNEKFAEWILSSKTVKYTSAEW